MMDEAAVELARDILDRRVDRIDGIRQLGGCIYNTGFYDAQGMGVLVGASDELESVPCIKVRGLWNEEAYERERARGEAILACYGDAIDEALSLVVAQLP